MRHHLFGSMRRTTAVVFIIAALFVVPVLLGAEQATVSSTKAVIPDLANARLTLTKYARVPRPTAMATRHGDDALYVVSKKGVLYSVRPGKKVKPVLDITREIARHFEQGFLGAVFSPSGDQLVINFSRGIDNASVTRTYDFDDGKVVLSSKKDMLVVPKPAWDHNGGMLAFGRDGYLYISIGDGGIQKDPTNNAQSLDKLLGKILRVKLEPNGSYTVPKDNPFVGRQGVRPEIWDYGFRNPWRFSFDRQTGDMWIGDVGMNTYEEIDRVAQDDHGGHNFGWNLLEGRVPFLDHIPPPSSVLPVYDYPHTRGCAVVGGYVYRGTRIPGLFGSYLYADYCTGRVQALQLRDHAPPLHRTFMGAGFGVSSFGQDADGELYLTSVSKGVVYRIDSPDG